VTLIVHVEGHTEESFVNEVLAPHLVGHGFATVRAGFIGGRQGGITSWTVAQRHIVNHLRDDATYVATTMVDYYGLPRTGTAAWPGRAEAAELPVGDKAEAIEERLVVSVAEEMGAAFDRNRFVPYVMMHEFEALLFSDCAASQVVSQFDFAPPRPTLARTLPRPVPDSPGRPLTLRDRSPDNGVQRPCWSRRYARGPTPERSPGPARRHGGKTCQTADVPMTVPICPVAVNLCDWTRQCRG